MQCWNCQDHLPDPSWGKLSFRAACDKCNADLHCCKNCAHYQPGSPNDCKIPDTEWVRDRTASNLCEDFSLLKKTASSKPNEARKKFDDIFK